MKVLSLSSRSMKVFVFALLTLAIIASLPAMLAEMREAKFEGKAKNREGAVNQAAINLSPIRPVTVQPAAPTGFTPQTRMGFTVDNEWEPAIASDRFGHVYVLYPQYGGVPGCATCYSPTMILQVSSDHGATWGSPRIIYPTGQTTGQWDAQLVVDSIDGKTVYSSWLQNGKSDIVVGKSTDYGATWTVVTADHTNAGTDKPILVARGQDVYVSYDHTQTAYVAYSHNGGASFTQVKVNQNAKLGWSLGGGGTITPNGNIYFSWDGYEGSGGAKGNVNLYISKSTDGGLTWTTKLLDVSKSPPDCSAFNCGWAFLGAAATMTSDASGNLYALWNAGSIDKGPERIYFAKSTDGGNTWSAKTDVSTALSGTHHAFPAIAATGNGDVRIAWMDARAANGGMDKWNVYYRRSTNGGSTWGNEVDLSTYVSGSTYIFTDGFRFPFGDYFEMDIDEQGTSHLIWGEGYSYDSPGSIWYSKGQ
ncbi:MAG: sialidase family protein [Chloroflexota bacterium]